MGVSEGVESGALHLLYACVYLPVGESVALSEHVFVFAYAVDKHGLAVQIEALIAVVARQRPACRPYTKRSYEVVGGLVVALYNAAELVEIRLLYAPKIRIAYRSRLSYGLGLARFQRYVLCEAYHLLAVLLAYLASQAYRSGVSAVVAHFGVYEYAVGRGIVPYVHAEGFYPHLVCYLKYHGAVNAEWL